MVKIGTADLRLERRELSTFRPLESALCNLIYRYKCIGVKHCENTGGRFAES
jgi:hypothetical protein